jgi:protein TonB
LLHQKQATEKIAPNTANTPVVDNTNTGTGTAINALPTTGGGGNGEGLAPSPATNEPVLTTALDKLPEFPGGMGKFLHLCWE